MSNRRQPSSKGGKSRSRTSSGGTSSRGRQSRGRSPAAKPRGRNNNRRPDDLGGDQVEGRQAVRELLAAGRRSVREVFVAEEVGDSAIVAEIVDRCGDARVPVRPISMRRLESIARTEAPQGVVAMAEPLRAVDLDDLIERRAPAGGGPFLVALDGVTDPGNLGAIVRSAEVAGASGAILPRHRAVRITPAAAKAAAGAVEHLPIALVGGLPAALKVLAERGIWVIGLDQAATADLDDLRVATEPVVLVLGSEGHGLSKLVRSRCDEIVSIPQAGRLESLNVSTAAAVACTEILRRRRSQRRMEGEPEVGVEPTTPALQERCSGR